MRLLSLQNDGRLSFTDYMTENILPYAILSHTWGSDDQEVTFEDVGQDVSLNTGKQQYGYRKIKFCGTQAAAHNLQHFWVDTCCINKSSATELQESITSMFRWYQNSAQCYVYLPDVHMDDMNPLTWQSAFRKSRWFTRGWTLQELLAPSSVEFFDREGKRLGDKGSLVDLLHEITNIPVDALQGRPLSTFSIDERMLWSRGRDTKRKEDKAYCLLGIFGVSMFLNYGEGEEHAMNRLRKEIQQPPGHRANQVTQCIIPLGRNKSFVGRDHILDELLKMISPDADPQDCQRIAIEGLGGVGKTQIALEAAFRLQAKEPSCSVFWVPAVSLATFKNGYRKIGEALKIPGINNEKADVDTLVTAALNGSSSKWLLVVDNADDTELLFGSGDGYAICDHLPFSTKGSILFTTRTHEVVVRLDISPDQTFTIDELSADEALKMLGKAIKPKQMQNSNSTRVLLDVLAHLPLAIKQAAAYMARTGISTEKYLDQYRHSDASRGDLLSRKFEDRSRYKDIANPIATTWLISFSHIETNYPLAARYLKLICFFGEKDIPRSLLSEHSEVTESDEAIGVLQGYSFVTEREDGNSFDIHRLVRLATRNSMDHEAGQYLTAAMRQLSRLYPYPEHENRDIWIKLIPHAETVLSINQTNVNSLDKADLFNKLGISSEQLGMYSVAQRMYFQSLQLRQEELGPKHPDTLVSMNNLALVLDSLGRYEEAEQMHRRALQLRQEELGPKHPATLISMDNLALVFRSLGKYEEAEQMHRQALQLSQEELGPKHPDTLINMSNLALVLDDLGRYEEAEQMHRQVLQLREKELGPKHPDTLVSMSSLALVLDNLGRYKEAEQMHRQALQLRQKELGPKHPATLVSMNNLASVLDSLGRYKEAEQMHRRELQLSQEERGLKHPDTLVSMSNLALVLGNLKRYEEAEQMHRRALQLRQEELGPKHPATLVSLNNLASVLKSLGEYEEAEQMHRQALQLRQEELGPRHPDTLISMYNLASVLQSSGKAEEAEQMYRTELQLSQEELGPKHPATLISVDNLASMLESLGNHEEAEQIRRQRLELDSALLGS